MAQHKSSFQKYLNEIRLPIKFINNDNWIDAMYYVDGTIKNITDFGAFIDLGGIDGLLHITYITWGRINHPSDRLNIGENINLDGGYSRQL